MLEADENQLMVIYPNGISKELARLVDHVQKRRHSSNIGTGPSMPETLLLITVIAEQQQKISELENLVNAMLDESPAGAGIPKPMLPKPDAIEETSPVIEQVVNWFTIKKGRKVTCDTEGGILEGKFKYAMRGDDNGMLQVTVNGSPNEFDVFKKSQVKLA